MNNETSKQGQTPATENLAQVQEDRVPSSWKRLFFRRRILVLGLVLALLVLFHGPILRTVACWMVVEQPVQTADAVLVLGETPSFNEAARLYREGETRHVLLPEVPLGRLQKMGIIPSSVAIARQELIRLGVPNHAINILPGGPVWDLADRVDNWLKEHPQANLALLCNRFESRNVFYIMHKVLNQDSCARIHIQALPNPYYDESNWWRTKEGTMDLVNGLLSFGYVWFNGKDSSEWQDWDYEEYERSLP